VGASKRKHKVMEIIDEQINDYLFIMIRDNIRSKIIRQTSNQLYDKIHDEMIVHVNSQVRRQVYHQVIQNIKL
jgi:hypothetical protein